MLSPYPAPADPVAASAAAAASSGSLLYAPRYALQASRLPLELLELPATLLEALALEPGCLRVLCKHERTGEALPVGLATPLAQLLRHTWYHPVAYHRMVRVVRGGAGCIVRRQHQW